MISENAIIEQLKTNAGPSRKLIKGQIDTIFLSALPLFFLLISLIFFPKRLESIESRRVADVLKEIPLEDREMLEDFFRALFVNGDFSFTLFGPKPMGLIDHSLQYTFRVCPKKWYVREVLFDLCGAATWNKLKHHFPENHFHFFVPEVPDREGVFSIVLINKEASRENISENLSYFKKKYGDQETAETILDKVIAQQLWDLQNAPHLYHETLGILLGYDKENAALFQEVDTLQRHLCFGPYKLDALEPEYLEGILSKNNCISLWNAPSLPPEGQAQKPKKLNKISFNSVRNPLFVVRPPFFLGSGEGDGKAIQKLYDPVRKELAEVFRSDRFLEIIITQLSS